MQDVVPAAGKRGQEQHVVLRVAADTQELGQVVVPAAGTQGQELAQAVVVAADKLEQVLEQVDTRILLEPVQSLLAELVVVAAVERTNHSAVAVLRMFVVAGFHTVAALVEFHTVVALVE